MGRPRKVAKDFSQTGADPVLRDDQNLSPADELVEALTEGEIIAALADFIEAGIKVKVTDQHWLLEKEFFIPRKVGLPQKKKLANTGSLQMPIASVVNAANFLYSQVQYVEQVIDASLKKGKKYSGIGEVIGKDGLPIDAA